MQSNSSLSNNPRNPLIKAAALEIEKTISGKKRQDVAVRVDLTFQKSTDMMGYAFDESGRRVTIRFSLAVREAHFTLTARAENGTAAKFNAVAFLKPLVVETKVSESRTSDSSQGTKLTLGGKASAEAKAALSCIDVVRGTSGSASAGGTAALHKNTASGSVLSQTVSTSTLNVATTYAGGEVHWSIKPAPISDNVEVGRFLSGSVFRGAGRNRRIFACRIRPSPGCPPSSWEVSGSVTAHVTDLDIEPIDFTYDDGSALQDVRLREIKQNDSDPPNAPRSISGSASEMKKRIVRQVIIKHLNTQNMRISGSSVEVCYANA